MAKIAKKNQEKKKTILDRVKSVLSGACVINTVIMAVIYVLGSITKQSDFGPHIYIMWMILGVSVAFSLAEKFLALSCHLAIRLAGHFLISLAGVYLIFGLGIQHISKNETGARAVAAVFIFVLLYIVVMGARFGLKNLFNRPKREGDEYEDVFDKDSQGK